MIVRTLSGDEFLIDLEDYSIFQSRTWGSHNTGTMIYLSFYDRAMGSRIYYHRVIMQASQKDIVDHIDRNSFNCQKVNLRLTTSSVNAHNATRPLGRSGYRGVFKRNRPYPYVAKINIRNKQVYIGQYLTPEEAARAWDKVAFTNFGTLSTLNFPEAYQ